MAIQGWNSGEGWNDLIKAKQDEDIRKREYFEKLGSDFGGGLTKGIDEGENMQKTSSMIAAMEAGGSALAEFLQKNPDMVGEAEQVYKAMTVGQPIPMTPHEKAQVRIAEDANDIKRKSIGDGQEKTRVTTTDIVGNPVDPNYIETSIADIKNAFSSGKPKEIERVMNQYSHIKILHDFMNKHDQSLERNTERKEKRTAKINIAKSVIDSAVRMTDLINKIENHDGYSGAVGLSLFPNWAALPGSDRRGVMALIDQLTSSNFIEGIKKYKEAGGAGSLSDSESAQLAKAFASLDINMPEKDWKIATAEIKRLVTKAARAAEGTLKGINRDDYYTLDEATSNLNPERAELEGQEETPDSGGQTFNVGEAKSLELGNGKKVEVTRKR